MEKSFHQLIYQKTSAELNMTTETTRLTVTKDTKMKKVCTKVLPKISAAGKQETSSKF